jgi:hypothetical protein
MCFAFVSLPITDDDVVDVKEDDDDTYEHYTRFLGDFSES